MDVNKIKEDTIKHFDKQWGDTFASFEHFGRADFVNHLLKCTNTTKEDWKNKVVFEGGAGNGRNTNAALKLDVAQITATDISPDAVKSIINNNQFRVLDECYATDLSKLDKEEDEIYDIAFSVNCIPHVPDYLNALRELARITKKGGLVCINVPPVKPIAVTNNDKALREVTTKMSHEELMGASKVIVAMANNRDIANNLKDVMELSGDLLSAYDHFGLPHTNAWTKEQITKELESVGLKVEAIDDKISIKARKL